MGSTSCKERSSWREREERSYRGLQCGERRVYCEGLDECGRRKEERRRRRKENKKIKWGMLVMWGKGSTEGGSGVGWKDEGGGEERDGLGEGNSLLVEQTSSVFALHKPAFNGQQELANRGAFIALKNENCLSMLGYIPLQGFVHHFSKITLGLGQSYELLSWDI